MAEKIYSKPSLREKIGYGFGDMSSSMFWKIFSYYLPFFYSNIFGLSLADAGVLLLITKLYDAVSDPVMGVIADRTRTKWGRYRPYLLWVAIPFALIGILTFTTPDKSYTFKLVYAYLSYILMMTAYTAINVPYGAMLGVITPSSKEKTVFSSFRMFFAYAGSFIALVIFEPLLKFFKGISVADPRAAAHSWEYSMAVIGAICAVLFILCFLMTKERVKDTSGGSRSSRRSVLNDLKSLVSNGPWWILLTVAVGVLLFNSVRGGVAAYYFKDVVGMGAIYTCGIFLAVGEISNMIGVALAVPVSNLMGKKNTYMLALAITIILSIVIGFLPQTKSGLWLLMGLQIIISAAAGITFPLLWSMFADIADWSENRTGVVSTGLIFSSSSMAQKFGAAFGSALILWVLAAYGYDTSEGAVQSAASINGLKAMMSWIPAIGAAIALIAMKFYPLTEKKMAEVSASLAVKRGDGQSA